MEFFEMQETMANIAWKTSDVNAYKLNSFDDRDCVQAEYIYLKSFLILVIARDIYGNGYDWKLFCSGCFEAIKTFNRNFVERGMYDLTWGFREEDMSDRRSEYVALSDPKKINAAFFAHLGYKTIPPEFNDFVNDCCIMMIEELTGKNLQ